MLRPVLASALLASPGVLGAQSALPHWADSLKAMRVVQLANGPNTIDLLGVGARDVVWRAWRDNNNAHGADYYTFYVADTAAEDSGTWQLVPIFQSTSPSSEHATYRSVMGADCILDDLWVLRSRIHPKAPVELVTARRDYGESFADWQPVTFIVYHLAARGEAEDGPRFYFKAVHTFRTQKSFCDVHAALKQVFGLGPDSS